MFDRRFPEHWTTNRKLIWLIGAVAQGASAIWKTVTGTLIHITDALASPMQKCEVSLEPIQDLHGQDAPYPAGGGKNKFNPSDLRLNKAIYGNDPVGNQANLFDSAATDTYVNIAYLDVGIWTISYAMNGTPISTNYRVGYVCDSDGIVLQTGIRTWESTTTTLQIEVTVAGYLWASFDKNAINLQIESGSSASPYAPFANICPITGWTGANVNVDGANLFNPNESFPLVDCYDYQGTAQTCRGVIYRFPNGTYTISATGDNSAYLNINVINEDGSFNAFYAVVNSSNKYNRTVTLTDGQYIVFYDQQARTGSTATKFSLFDIMINVGSSASPYKQFNGTTLSVTFPDSAGTVYGGTVDLVSGVLTVDRAVSVFDGSVDEQWVRFSAGSASAYAMQIPLSNFYYVGSANTFISNYLQSISSGATWGNYDYFISTNASDYLITGFKPITTVEAWRNYLAQNPLQVLYELAEPIEIQLTPQQISTLAGENNVWSNSNGDTTIIYKAQSE